MLPSADQYFSLRFVLWVILSLYAGIVIHELGHVVAGSLVGLQVVACGLGRRRPFLCAKLFGICFYIAYPLSPGLTIVAFDHIRARRRGLSTFILGGPAANVCAAAASLGLWHLGLQCAPVTAFFWVSLLLLLGSLPPYAFRAGQAVFRTDALMAIQYWRKTWHLWETPGQQLATLTFVRELCRSIDAWPGVVSFTLATALYQAHLGDFESARETLADESLRDPRRGMYAMRLEELVRYIIESVSDPATAQGRMEEVARAHTDDPEVQLLLKLMEAEMALEMGLNGTAIAREAQQMARQLGVASLETAADVLVFESDAPADASGACRDLLARRGAQRPAPMAALRLLCAATQVLAMRGQQEEARRFFADAVTRLTGLAWEIASEQTRGRFLERMSRPLRAAAAAAAAGVPIFVPTDTKPIPRTGRYGWTGIACAATAIATLAVAVRLLTSLGTEGSQPRVTTSLFFLTFTLSTFGLVISALALFRPTHRRGIALLALILNSLVMFPVLLALWEFSTDTSSAQVDQGQPDYDEIIEDLTIAIQTNPNNSIFYRHRGYAYVQKRDFDSAIQDLTEAIRLEPDLASMYQERGQAYLQKGDREKALADFARAREIRLLEANPH